MTARSGARSAAAKRRPRNSLGQFVKKGTRGTARSRTTRTRSATKSLSEKLGGRTVAALCRPRRKNGQFKKTRRTRKY
jgi:hypothetical protein